MTELQTDYKKHQVLCREGDPSSELYYLKSGKLLVCSVHGTEVKAIARIGPGEFVGELSFFDGHPRATYVMTIEDSSILHLPKHQVTNELPYWYLEIGKNLTKKIRVLDQVINQTHFKKTGAEDQTPLTINEQRIILAAITN